jgi:hypothetical protein
MLTQYQASGSMHPAHSISEACHYCHRNLRKLFSRTDELFKLCIAYASCDEPTRDQWLITNEAQDEPQSLHKVVHTFWCVF